MVSGTFVETFVGSEEMRGEEDRVGQLTCKFAHYGWNIPKSLTEAQSPYRNELFETRSVHKHVKED